MADGKARTPEGFGEKNLESTSDPDFSRGILALDNEKKAEQQPTVDFAGTTRPRSTGTITSISSNTSTGSRGTPCSEPVAKGFFSRKVSTHEQKFHGSTPLPYSLSCTLYAQG